MDSKDSDQTGQVPRLIGVFLGTQVILLVLSCCSSNVGGWCEEINFTSSDTAIFNNHIGHNTTELIVPGVIHQASQWLIGVCCRSEMVRS